MANKPLVAASMLAADMLNLRQDVLRMEDACDWFHLDIMDGVFVPNISFGQPIVKAIRPLTQKVLDVHLMIEQPERYIEEFVKLGADMLTVHAEACPHLHRTIQQIHEAGVQAGVALNPSTPLSSVEWVLEDVDMVLLMTVNPGFGGQKAIPAMVDKVAKLRSMMVGLERRPLIQVDGGIGIPTYQPFRRAGADVFVMGTSLFTAVEPASYAAALKTL